MTEASRTTPGTHPRADCTVDTDGRIVFSLRTGEAVASPSSRSPRLLLRLRTGKDQPEEVLHVLDLEPGDDGRRRAVLEPRPTLTEGRWDVYLLPEPGAERQRLRPGLRDLRALVDGQSRDWPAPVAVRVPYTTKDGYLAVRAWLRTAHAEVEGIDVTDRSVTVRARLHGASLSGESAVLLRPRDGNGAERSLAARPGGDGRTFSFTVDHEELVTDGGTASRVWDIGLRTASGTEAPSLRVGRLLDDIADRKEIFVYPAATVGAVAVRPRYTIDNDLSVEVTPAT
ncbi:transferase [Streptomyces sp. NPDC014995]|uniref:transferase n=1 Tax=Streptomyces sp. NPDC014995 TaxID=3364936 RepID=UPI0036F84F98